MICRPLENAPSSSLSGRPPASSTAPPGLPRLSSRLVEKGGMSIRLGAFRYSQPHSSGPSSPRSPTFACNSPDRSGYGPARSSQRKSPVKEPRFLPGLRSTSIDSHRMGSMAGRLTCPGPRGEWESIAYRLLRFRSQPTRPAPSELSTTAPGAGMVTGGSCGSSSSSSSAVKAVAPTATPR